MAIIWRSALDLIVHVGPRQHVKTDMCAYPPLRVTRDSYNTHLFTTTQFLCAPLDPNSSTVTSTRPVRKQAPQNYPRMMFRSPDAMHRTAGLNIEAPHGMHALSAPCFYVQPLFYVSTASSKENTEGDSAFLSLPPELRNRIYNYFFQGINDIVSINDDDDEYTGETSSGTQSASPSHSYKFIEDLRPYLDLTQTCHQIRHECLSMLFEEHIAQHNWHTRFDNESAFFQLMGFIRCVTPATAWEMQFCLMFDVGKSDRPFKNSFAGHVLDIMKRSYPDPDHFTFRSKMPALPLTSEYGNFENVSTPPPGLVTTGPPTWRHDDSIRGLVGDPQHLAVANVNEPTYSFLYRVGEAIVLQGRLARLDWNDFNYEFSLYYQRKWPAEFTPDEDDVKAASDCSHVD